MEEMMNRKAGLVLCTLIVFWVGCALFEQQQARADADFTITASVGIPTTAPIRIERVQQLPVLQRGAEGAWDGVDLLNPSVIHYKGKLFNYYSGYDGNVWHTGVATSKDGINWDKFFGNPVLSPSASDWDVSYIAANGAAVEKNGNVLYFYQGVDATGHTQIGLAISKDGYHFTNQSSPVLTVGNPYTWESQHVADPYVITMGNYFYLYYLGQDELGTQRLGVARSMDGISWEKFSGNPILEPGKAGTFDEKGVGEPSIAYYPPYFYMIYTGRDKAESRNLGYAISTDGTRWSKMSTSGLLADRQRAPWFSKVICDTTLLPMGNGKWKAWFGGGDRPESAQNLNGQVGMMVFDFGQNRDMAAFDVNDGWAGASVRSTDVLRGSFPIEGDENNRYAWVGPQSHITLVVNETDFGKALILRGWAPAAMITKATGQSAPQVISMAVSGKTYVRQAFTDDANFSLKIPWLAIGPAISGDGTLDLELRSNRSFVPADFGAGPDRRDISFSVRSIRFE